MRKVYGSPEISVNVEQGSSKGLAETKSPARNEAGRAVLAEK